MTKAYLVNFPTKRKPDSIDAQGRSVFEVSDCFEAANKAFKFLHGDIPTPESDRRYDAMMLERQLASSGLSPDRGGGAKHNR